LEVDFELIDQGEISNAQKPQHTWGVISHQGGKRKPDRGEPGNGSQSSGWEAHRERSSRPPESEARSQGEVAR
jgi:hypothetical protein